MSRPRSTEADAPVTLLPFLSVLAGIMGTLSLVVSAMTLVGIEKSDQVIEMPLPVVNERTAVFVECRSDGLQFVPQGTRVTKAEVLRREGPYHKLLQEIKAHENQRYLSLLIRPDGIDSFQAALAMAEEFKIKVGYEPVFIKGEIKLRPAQPEGQP